MYVYISHAIMQEVQSLLLSISLLKQYLMLHIHISSFLERMYFMDTILYTSVFLKILECQYLQL